MKGSDLVCAVVLVASFGGGLPLWRRLGDRPPLVRIAGALVPGVLGLTALALVAGTVEAALFYWNAPRVAMAMGLARGWRLFYPPDAGPVLNTIYAPLSVVAYLPVGLFRQPAQATLAAGAIGLSVFFAPAAWAALALRPRDRDGWITAALVFGLFAAAALSSGDLRGSALHQPVDAVALGLGGAAVTALAVHLREGSLRALTAAAVLTAGAVWSKQTMAPLVVALPGYLLLARGWRPFLSLVWRLAAAGALVTAAVLAAFRPAADLFFNLWSIPAHHPERADAVPFMYLRALLLEARAWPILAGVGAVAVLASWRLGPQAVPGRPAWRGWLADHPWLVFLWTSAWLLPTSWLGFMKEGGRINSLSAHTYFVALGGCLCFLGTAAFPRAAAAEAAPDAERIGRAVARWSLPAAGLGLAVFSLPFGHTWDPAHGLLWTLVGALAVLALAAGTAARHPAARRLDLQALAAALVLWLPLAVGLLPGVLDQLDGHAEHRRTMRAAYLFAVDHPQEVYFPYDPLTSLLLDGELYHFDYGLYDRRLAGHEVSPEHFRAALPRRIKYVVYPSWVAAADTPRESLRFLTEFSERVELLGMDRWEVYMRPEDVPSVQDQLRPAR